MADSRPSAHFDRAYWSQESQYRKFEDYGSALEALRSWYRGLLRLIEPEVSSVGRHLDVGCGHGAIVHELLDRGWDARGFDASSWIISQAKSHDRRRSDRFAVGDIADVPFEGAFDLITCLEVLEHVEDPVSALHSMGRLLTPGGRLVATTPNRRPLLPWWDAESMDPTHVSVHEPAWWRRAIVHAGLREHRIETFVAVPLLWRLHPSLAWWQPLGRRAGPSVLMVAARAALPGGGTGAGNPARGG